MTAHDDDSRTSIAAITELADRLGAWSELLREHDRASRIAQGLPADPPRETVEELRAKAAELRARNDAFEAERLWHAS